MSNPYKEGDFVLLAEDKHEILAVHGDWCWVLGDDVAESGRLRKYSFLVPWAPFRVGHTYVSNYSSGRTFDCHFIGNIGAVQDNKKYAAGQLIENDKPFAVAAILFRDSGNWTEI